MSDVDQPETTEPVSTGPGRESLQAKWAAVRTVTSKVPRKAWFVLAVFLSAALLMALYSHVIGRNAAVLRVRVQHSFRSAKLNLWVDGDLAYSGKLSGSARKKFGLIPEAVQGTLTQSVPIASGTHTVRVNIDSGDGSVHEDTISGDFPSGGERTLTIIARRTNLAVSWQGAPATVTAADTAAPSSQGGGFLQRYGGSLMMTVIGSIVSAFTGFAIREFPKQLGSRTEKA
ncbi:MAG: hypothetical protein M3O09_14350 [Acidobacteriota bacterium]|nr:hypothetical protein [Acidobacteriota bacterium]